MAIPKRHGRLPGTYFITSRTWESRALFTQETACRIFIETLLRYRDDGAYQLHAFVLMPDHFHALLTPSLKMTIERAVQYIKGGSARRIGKDLEFRFPVWQRGFSDHRIRNAADFRTHLRYAENNPVRKRLAETSDSYLWSSASNKYKLDEPPQRLKPLRDL